MKRAVYPVSALKRRLPEAEIWEEPSLPSEGALRRGVVPPLLWAPDGLVWSGALCDRLREAGWKEIPVVLLEGEEARPLNRITAALECENRAGAYTWEEQARIYELCRTYGLLEEAERIVPLVVPGKRDFSHVERYLSLPASFREMVREGKVDLKTAWEVRDLPDPVGGLVSYYPHRMTFSERRQILVMLAEIVRREGLDERAAMHRAGELLASPKPLEAVWRARFPRLAGMEDSFAASRRRLLDGTGVALEAPPGFEGHSLRVSFRFSSRTEFGRRMKALSKLEEHLDEFLSFLG
ncbi:hypothetical protein Spith_0179 [Spirochaeta thermophila DSM 6578]|uniref:ParB/Sulfiredoxin domain-containing protein n=1 Tax=Winmispira thermophila (strain ATCC 700085 / DSM 6578 / Z-1203) TaxID=869211 RepID=G0GCP7_WINT7|nr:hypothetical protein [Spirochaeta thermophila]AEJ60466.1 hypothetical protein Spith_0179 [Spirochaeta thermophila DSM 6578]